MIHVKKIYTYNEANIDQEVEEMIVFVDQNFINNTDYDFTVKPSSDNKKYLITCPTMGGECIERFFKEIHPYAYMKGFWSSGCNLRGFILYHKSSEMYTLNHTSYK